MSKTVTMSVFAGLLVATAVAVAGGNWSDAERKYDEFKQAQESLKKLTPSEVKRMVSAICDAEEDERKAVASDIKERVRSTIDEKYDDLESAKDDALKYLGEVQADEALKDQHDQAESLAEDVKGRWAIVERMTQSLRGSNHPVVAWMLERGQTEHRERQEDCDAYELTLRSGKRVDCLMAKGSTCLVIELKPNNSRAVSKGHDQARGYADELNDELKKKDSEYIKKLIDKDSDFAKCEKFEDQVDCYKLCPDVDEQGEFRSVSVDWEDDC